MGKPGARISDFHVCPMVTGLVPHIGGPIIMGAPNVLVGGLPAARVGDMATCVGPPDTIAMGSLGVFIAGPPAARMLDTTVHGGKIMMGCPTVLIGDIKAGSGGGGGGAPVMNQVAQAVALQNASRAGDAFCEVCAKSR